MKIYYEADAELLTIFWAEPQKTQIAEELVDDGILIRDEVTGESIGIEFFNYQYGDRRLLDIENEISLELLPSYQTRVWLTKCVDDLIQPANLCPEQPLEFHFLRRSA